MGRGSGANTVTSVNQPPPQVMAAYQNLLGQAQNVANTLLEQYTGPLVAGFTPASRRRSATLTTRSAAAEGLRKSARPRVIYPDELLDARRRRYSSVGRPRRRAACWRRFGETGMAARFEAGQLLAVFDGDGQVDRDGGDVQVHGDLVWLMWKRPRSGSARPREVD